MRTDDLTDAVNRPKAEGEVLYNYLKPYEIDKWARDRMEDPIEFDWGRVSELDAIETDEKWFDSPMCKASLAKGYRYQKVLVVCPNPEHGTFNTIMNDPPNERDLKCPHCITKEMNRILSLRYLRDEENRKNAKENKDGR